MQALKPDLNFTDAAALNVHHLATMGAHLLVLLSGKYPACGIDGDRFRDYLPTTA